MLTFSARINLLRLLSCTFLVPVWVGVYPRKNSILK
uniref:ORF35 n=1 Tax=Chlamydomonas reinhardtii TaxID=3055 RepID=Q33370_CHLRE|nr:unnamed protein product [Chlamydomonas reinhardtii]